MGTSSRRSFALLAALIASPLCATPFAQSAADSMDRNHRQEVSTDSLAYSAYMKASNTGAGDAFGRSVAISGNTIVVGAVNEDGSATGVNGNEVDDNANSSGAAYVYVRSGSTWIQQAYLKASNTDPGDSFGFSVAISGDTIVVGAPGESSGADGVGGSQGDNSQQWAGAAYVFVRNGTTWSQQAYLKAHNSGSLDRFGESLALEGDTLVVGADQEDSSTTGVNNGQNNSAAGAGAAYVFVRNGTTWSQQAFLKASNTDSNDRFGESVGLSGDTIAVGAGYERSAASGIDGNQNDNNAPSAGAAYIFRRNGTNWSQEAYVKASNTESLDRYGISIAIEGDALFVGAYGESSGASGVNGNQASNSANGAGAVYVYRRNGTTWSHEAYLKASNTDPGDHFGLVIAPNQERVAIGAPNEASSGLGLNGAQGNDSALNSGAVYVFEENGGSWQQCAYVKATNTEWGDFFSSGIALDERTLVIGATGEDGSTTGLDGVQNDNSAADSGAAYLYKISNLGSGYCFGDGSGTPCPCTNGSTGRGCGNSFRSGARLEATGSADFGLDTFGLEAYGLPPGAPGLCIKGSIPLNADLGSAVGDGLLCTTPQLRSQIIVADAADGIIYMNDWRGQPFGTYPNAANAGATTYYQWWYRDQAGSCTGDGFNFTNGWVVEWR